MVKDMNIDMDQKICWQWICRKELNKCISQFAVTSPAWNVNKIEENENKGKNISDWVKIYAKIEKK